MKNKDREVLEEMVWQFAHRGVKNGKPIIYTGGLSALDAAFEILGWENPHYLPDAEGYCCEIEGCVGPNTCGVSWGGLYLNVCSEHCHDAFSNKPRPKVKQWALNREARRDPNTGILSPSIKEKVLEIMNTFLSTGDGQGVAEAADQIVAVFQSEVQKLGLISDEQRDNCTPTEEEVERFLSEPDDEVAAKIRSSNPSMFIIIAKTMLYGRKIAQAQLQHCKDTLLRKIA